MTGKWALLPLAGAGFLLAHEASYRLVEHDHVHRNELLADTGHTWLPIAGPALILMGVLAAAAGWLITVQQERQPRFWQILVAQSGAFFAVEILERLISGHDPIPQAGILLTGAAAQLPVAMMVWLIFVGILMPYLRVWRAPSGTRPQVFWQSAAYDLQPRPLSSQAHLVSVSPRGPPSSGM